jgi:sugar phosphate isomerase/epimerase
MRIGLSVYGTIFSMGIHTSSNRTMITPKQLIDQALAAGLEGVEIPIVLLQNEDLLAIKRYAQERELFISLETSGYNPEKLAEAIEVCQQLGVRTLRTVVGGARLGGDRRLLAGRWQAFLQDILAGLRKAQVKASRSGVNLAVENHQDLTSEELLWLCESIGSQHFGIVLDTGNTLATAEDPVDFARTVATFIKHVHLKDYRIYLYEEGYRLVRCPLGQGVVNFHALFDLFAEACPQVTMSIELGALEARYVRVLADDYWQEYPPRSAAQFAHVLNFVLAKAQQTSDWRTPFERHEPAEAIIAYEEQQLAESITYIEANFKK